jgi:hypothetical protein
MVVKLLDTGPNNLTFQLNDDEKSRIYLEVTRVEQTAAPTPLPTTTPGIAQQTAQPTPPGSSGAAEIGDKGRVLEAYFGSLGYNFTDGPSTPDGAPRLVGTVNDFDIGLTGAPLYEVTITGPLDFASADATTQVATLGRDTGAVLGAVDPAHSSAAIAWLEKIIPIGLKTGASVDQAKTFGSTRIEFQWDPLLLLADVDVTLK